MTDFDIAIPENQPAEKTPVTQQAQSQQVNSGVDLPDVAIGSKNDEPTDLSVPDAKDLAVKFGIIGSGQGGNRLCDTFYQIGYRRVCAVNTTAQDFLGLSLPVANQLILDSSEGGAGKDPTKGAEAVDKSSEEIMNLMRRCFGENIDRILVCAGFGGGTGTGSAEKLVKLARYYMRQLGKEEKVGMIASLPKLSEGGKVQENAYKAMKSIQPLVESKKISPFIVCDNESIHKMFPNVSAKQFWQTANKNTVGLFDIFNVLACQRSQYVTFDRADYNSILDSGIIIFGATKLDSYEHDTDISDGLRNNLKRTLLADIDVSKASCVAAILCAPDAILDILPQSHIDLAFSTLERILGGENRNLMVHQGVYEANKMGLFLYTMVGGLGVPEHRLNIMKARSGIDPMGS